MNFRDRNEWNDWSSSTRLRGIIEIGDGGGGPGPDPGNGDGLTGTYYNNRDFTDQTLTRVDPTVDFDWGGGSPAASMGNNTFSVRWQGQIEPLYSETYTFRTTSDDGVRLWVNGQQIIDQFIDQAPTNHTGQITLQAGQKYDIRMDYYENSGGAVAQLAWSSASQPLQIVPQSQLYSDGGGEPPKTLNKEDLVSGLVQPTAVDWLPGQDKMLIAEQRGVVKLRENGTLSSTPFIDISSQVNGTRDRGLLDIAVHPNFPQSPYVYMLFTYDPPQVYDNASHPLAGPDKNGNRAGRLIRVTADASNGYRTAVPNSEVVLLGTNSTWDNFNAFVDSTVNFSEAPAGIRPDGTNVQDFIATDSQSHTVGGLEFGKDGNLYVSIGDGTSYNRMDPRTVRVQDIDNLSGKVLRIDPITGNGVSDNPFYNGNANANRSKVYQYGVRNPFRTTVHPDTGRLYIGDVGWNSWEEINTGSAGSNFGWPFYEGGKNGSLRTSNYEDLPEAQAFYASGQTVTAPFLGLSHASDNINAIVMGDVYTGNTYPDEYQGDLFYSELYTGRVRNVSFDANGNIADIDTFTTGANVVVQMAMGPDGNLYYVDLDDGTVGRWVFS
ncbi:MAG: PQQ-dependent sugar dehydrogenase [Cyanobacteria bacterium J06629_9]